MSVVATATISGDEARGRARLVRSDDGLVMLEVDDLVVAPGAPDVRMYLSSNTDGALGDRPVELGGFAESVTRLRRDLPVDVDIDAIGSVVIHCTVYSVLFGYGVFERVGNDGS